MQFTAKGPIGVPDIEKPIGRRNGVRIGEILVHQGVLSQEQVDSILEQQRASSKPFGDIAERLYGVSPQVVEDAWVEQYRRETGTTDLDEIACDADCLRRINRRQAWQFHIVPISRQEGQIQVATHADNLARGLNFAGRTFGDPVLMLLAERDQLRDFLMRHYPVPSHIKQYAETLTT